ncbi:hypothetical protein C8Q80DRAFT_1267364 [Daedaleopsis nitida]|nr:hypothetical protein C8Q80DRAFT_1267364 [Daedaleopsis nitida]
MSDRSYSSTQGTQYDPFSNPAVGDMVIQTLDGARFYVDKRIMAQASSWFAGKCPPPLLPSPGTAEKKFVVPVNDDYCLWEKLLPILYSSLEQPVAFADLGFLLHAAKKYRMAGVSNVLGQLLLSVDMMEEPLQVYALACAFGFQDAARAAARRMLRLPVYVGYVAELHHASAAAYHRLLDYRRRCGDAVRAVLRWQTSPPVWMLDMDMSVTDGGIDEILRSWRAGIEGLEGMIQDHPDLTPTFSPALLQPLLQALPEPAEVMSHTHKFAEVLDGLVLKAIDEVELEFD